MRSSLPSKHVGVAHLLRVSLLGVALALGLAPHAHGQEYAPGEDPSVDLMRGEIVVSTNLAPGTPVEVEANEEELGVYIVDRLQMIKLAHTLGAVELRLSAEGYEPFTQQLENGMLVDAVEAQLVAVPPSVSPVWPLAVLVALCLLVGGGIFALRARRSRAPEAATNRFDRYYLDRVLGYGGIATVYLADDKKESMQVALKIMNEGLMDDVDLVRKFLREGEVLKTIAKHDPTAPVVKSLRYGREAEMPEGRPFLALEYLSGQTLRDHFKTAPPLSLRSALGVARQVCHGLAPAHAHDIWHRDVSPDNVMIVGEEDGQLQVKLIDFGVAKNEHTMVATVNSAIIGKPSYMSPEQCRGDNLDARSDLYAVGVLLYALVTGAPPFVGRDPVLVMQQHRLDPVPPLPEDLPEEFKTFVMTLLEKEADKRPASAEAVIATIEELEAAEKTQPYRSARAS